MKEVLLTSSALIIALLALRRMFRKKISRRVQYALWSLILLRLLVPANLPAADFSVLSVSEPARTRVERRLERDPVYVLPVQRVPAPAAQDRPPEDADARLPREDGHTVVTEDGKSLTTYAFTLEEALDLIWKIGMGGMAAWMAGTNLRFWRGLRKKRIPLDLPECRYPVYLMEEGLVSPCLFGLFRPAVYLTPAALEDKAGLRHVLVHEETHGRHRDPLWSLLRGVCLTVYWFDPLVWLAAAASREDCELACDEGALARLGEEHRIPYGQTLLRLIPLKRARGGALLTATTMTSDKKRMRERITRIAENRKMKTAALCAALGATAAVCAATFTGCAAAAKPETADPAEADVPPSDLPSAIDLPDADTLTIPLTDLTPCEPEKADGVYAGADHHDGHHEDPHGPHMTDGSAVWEPFTDVLGYDGVMVSYIGQDGSGGTQSVNDYYFFEGDGAEAYRLARVYGCPYLIDLNGDGQKELVGTDGSTQAQIFFRRDGKVYEADIAKLLAERWERWEEDSYLNASFSFLGWSENSQYLEVDAYVPAVTGKGVQTSLDAKRRLYFDGANLLLCRPPEREMTDHVLDGVQDLNVVVDAARAYAEACFADWAAGYGEGWSDEYHALPEWDDYCVTGVDLAYPTEPEQAPEGTDLLVYRVGFEVHTPVPADVIQAGGMYVGEDGWVGGFWMDASPYLAFQVLEDGSYKQLEIDIPADCFPKSNYFSGAITVTMLRNGLTAPEEASGERLYFGAMCNPAAFAGALARYSAGEQDAALEKMLAYAEGAGEYETGQVKLLTDAGYDYSPEGAAVIERLRNMM